MIDPVEIFKVLANKKRLEILTWLKDPAAHFATLSGGRSGTEEVHGGVCVRDIQEKANMSQSTISHYLQMMQKAGLLDADRVGQWTYYRRNEEAISKAASYLQGDL